jgi:hypothetical protein
MGPRPAAFKCADCLTTWVPPRPPGPRVRCPECGGDSVRRPQPVLLPPPGWSPPPAPGPSPFGQGVGLGVGIVVGLVTCAAALSMGVLFVVCGGLRFVFR